MQKSKGISIDGIWYSIICWSGFIGGLVLLNYGFMENLWFAENEITRWVIGFGSIAAFFLACIFIIRTNSN